MIGLLGLSVIHINVYISFMQVFYTLSGDFDGLENVMLIMYMAYISFPLSRDREKHQKKKQNEKILAIAGSELGW